MTETRHQALAPVLIVPFVWIGDFVRAHSVVKLLREQAPERPVDIVSSTLCSPLASYMPGVRDTIIADIPRRRLGLRVQLELAARLRQSRYAQAFVMSRKWKAALAPWLAGISLRTGFAGEFRFGLLNDVRFGERTLPRMIDQMGALALPRNTPLPHEWPLPELKVPPHEVQAWRLKHRLASDRPVVALSPGAVGAGKAWPVDHYASLAAALAKDGISVWVLGGPNETVLAQQIVTRAGRDARDLTGTDLRNAIMALAAVDASVTNDSGLMHVSAAIGTPTVAIFGPTSPWHWKPLNPIASILEPPDDDGSGARARVQGNAAVRHRRTERVTVDAVLASVRPLLSRDKAQASGASSRTAHQVRQA
ncbi:MAG TPA: lipopolysaccharide heptosyltransferase II [Pseudolabrys sp.]|nr:lipopolysaccharide heptosyltransferase II [Pseudolabrys sp.]